MHRIIVLGAGRVGRVIARDLNDDPEIEVTIADRRSEWVGEVAGNLGCAAARGELGDPDAISGIVADHDLAIGALPGSLGLSTLEGIVAAGKKCVDISFLPEDPRSLDEKARETGATVLYDFGVAPGMSNLLAARAARRMDNPRHVKILVGGLPVVRRAPWEYAAPFSPADVMEEYVRPARIKVGGNCVDRTALSGIEAVEFSEIGTLEAFYTDGLRSLIDTVPCPNMEEKTLRYPGYAEKIRLLRDSGFLGKEPIEVNGASVVPLDVATKILEPAWFLDESMDDFTVMRISVVGGERAPYRRCTWSLLDYADRTRGETSMARTTGFPAAIAARRLLDGTADLGPGVHPPEALASNDSFVEGLLSDLKARGVVYRKEET